MDFSTPRTRRRIDTIVPMINIVFLLLIFFLLTATIAPPAPIEVEPPESAAEAEVDPSPTLHLAADGRLAYRDAVGEEAALAALAEEGVPGSGQLLLLRADRRVPAARVAELVARLGALGVTDLRLVAGGG